MVGVLGRFVRWLTSCYVSELRKSSDKLRMKSITPISLQFVIVYVWEEERTYDRIGHWYVYELIMSRNEVLTTVLRVLFSERKAER